MNIAKYILAIVSLSIFFSLFQGCSGSDRDGLTLKVKLPDDVADILVPVTVELPGADDDGLWALHLTSGDEKPVYGQTMTRMGKKSTVFLLNPAFLQNNTLLRVQEQRASSVVPQVFTFDEQEDTFLTLSEDGAPVLRYVYGMNLKEGVPEDRRRSNYLHPVYGLDGEILTDDFPEDHHHHRGIFLAWPQIIVDGDSLELWHIQGIEKRFEQWIGRETGPVFARMGVHNGWYAGGKKVVDETVWITAFRKGDVGRIIDIEFTLTATKSPVKIVGSPGLKGYGGLNYRTAPFTDEIITTDEGIQQDSDLRRFPWADFSAIFGDSASHSGLSIFQDRANLNAPNGWCLRHYGFLGVAWPGNNPYLLQPGKPLNLRYRIWIHRGDADEGRVSAAYEYSTHPIEAAIVE